VTSVAAATQSADHETVEELVRAQLSAALGGRRGMLEGAIPTIAFTLTWVLAHDLRLALTVSLALAVAALLLRVVQRQPTRFVLNALIGIGIGAFIASRTGEAKDVFLPGILTNAGYAVAMLASVVLRWPLMGFLLGSVTGDPTSWREDAGIVRLCSRLTLVLAVPCVLRVLVQLPLYLAGCLQGGPGLAAPGGCARGDGVGAEPRPDAVRRDRDHPSAGDLRLLSPLGSVEPDRWIRTVGRAWPG
jgi:hypothetical protein